MSPYGVTRPQRVNSGTTAHVVCPTMPNTMPGDALVTLGARATAGMVLDPRAGIFCLQHQMSSYILWCDWIWFCDWLSDTFGS